MVCERFFAHRARRAEMGFTLIELMITVTLLVVLGMLAAPMFQDAMLSNKLTSYTNTFVSSVQLAKSESIKRNTTVKLCRSANGTACATTGGWQQGWIVFTDTGAGANSNNGVVDADETRLLYQQALATDYSFTSGTAYVLTFQPSGVGSTQETLTICRSAGAANRTITLSSTGRTTVEKGTASSC